MTELTHDDRIRIAAHLSGTESSAGYATTAQWIDEDPRRGAELARMRRLWVAVKPKASTNEGANGALAVLVD